VFPLVPLSGLSQRSVLVFGSWTIRLLAEASDILTEVFHAFHQYLQANAGAESRWDQEHFLPNPLQFIIQLSFYTSMLCPDTQRVVKQQIDTYPFLLKIYKQYNLPKIYNWTYENFKFQCYRILLYYNVAITKSIICCFFSQIYTNYPALDHCLHVS
jgi:hypothetical protein